MTRICVPILLLLLIPHARAGAVDAPASHAGAADALDLARYSPPPRVIARAESVDAIIAATKPAMVAGCEMIWVERNERGRSSFVVGPAQWVRQGGGPPFWALLRPGNPAEQERDGDGQLSSDIRDRAARDVPIVHAKPSRDHGSGNYAIVLLREHGCDLYEIGLQTEGLGTGHPIDERRLYVLHVHEGRHAWRFVGEGPPESSGKCGQLCEGRTTTVNAQINADRERPVTIHFTTHHGHALVGEGVSPALPELPPIEQDWLLDGPPPATLRSISRPYLRIVSLPVTLDDLIDRFIYWEVRSGNSSPPSPRGARTSVAARRWILDQNPALAAADNLGTDTIVYLPTREELSR